MKHTIMAILPILAILLALTILTSGCGSLNTIVEKFQQDNPDAGMIPIDDDGDGTPEAFGVDLDGDHRVDRDDDGNMIEVPGSRVEITELGQMDTDVGELITLVGSAFGIGGGILGGWWSRRKPIKKLNLLATSIEKAKVKGAPEGMIQISKELLELYLSESPGFIEALNKTRAAEKAVRKRE